MLEEEKTAEGGTVIKIPIEEEVKKAYIDYSMSVIVQRALPDVRDGLKPVHRRIMFSMDKLGLSSKGATRKCAQIVGDVLGHYHPHGDASVYDALVRLGQDFSQRYTTVIPQGNFGTIGGDPAAAYRYTEAKMSKITEEMNFDLDNKTVDFVENFDGREKEPTVLPAKFPFLLCNGTTGIAVGMATNMPPHNLREVANAISAYIDNPEISIDELMTHIKGPDFPTGGVIYGREGIKKAYRTGRGKITIRAKFNIETDKRGREKIVFTEVPYGVNTTNIINKILSLRDNKIIEGISDANDETSDRVGLRLVVELKKNAITKIVLNQLFAKTELQSNFGVINLALVPVQRDDNTFRYDEPGYLSLPSIYLKPQVLTLKQLIGHFVNHRDEVVTRRTINDLIEQKAKMHIMQALIIAINNIEEVIKIIRASRDTEEAKLKLEERFKFDDVQAQHIVDMPLRKLTHLQIEELENDIKACQAKIDYDEDLLAHHEKILAKVKDETQELAQNYGDDRRTDIVVDEVEQINTEDMIKEEEVVVMISKMGYIKRVPLTQYKAQSRGGKGSMSANLIEDDYINQIFIATTKAYITFFTNAGKVYWIKVHEIPEASRTSRGSSVKALLQLNPDEEISTIVTMKEYRDDEYIFMSTANGVVKKCQTTEFSNAKTRGVIGIKLREGDKLVSAILTTGKDDLMLVTRRGQALRVNEESVRPMGRASSGVTGIRISGGDELAAAIRVQENFDALVITEKGVGKRVAFDEFGNHGRGTGGQRIFGNVDGKGEIIGAIAVAENEEVICMTGQGKTIRVKASSISKQGRASSGTRVINIEEPDYVVGFDKSATEQNEEDS